MTQTFQGRTQDAEAPFLNADFWSDGKAVSGEVVRAFETQNGRAYVLKLDEPVSLDGEEADEVSIGALKGFGMAMQAARLKELLEGDIVHLECTSKAEPRKEGYSPRINFDLRVVRKKASGF